MTPAFQRKQWEVLCCTTVIIMTKSPCVFLLLCQRFHAKNLCISRLTKGSKKSTLSFIFFIVFDWSTVERFITCSIIPKLLQHLYSDVNNINMNKLQFSLICLSLSKFLLYLIQILPHILVILVLSFLYIYNFYIWASLCCNFVFDYVEFLLFLSCHNTALMLCDRYNVYSFIFWCLTAPEHQRV